MEGENQKLRDENSTLQLMLQMKMSNDKLIEEMNSLKAEKEKTDKTFQNTLTGLLKEIESLKNSKKSAEDHVDRLENTVKNLQSGQARLDDLVLKHSRAINKRKMLSTEELMAGNWKMIAEEGCQKFVDAYNKYTDYFNKITLERLYSIQKYEFKYGKLHVPDLKNDYQHEVKSEGGGHVKSTFDNVIVDRFLENDQLVVVCQTVTFYGHPVNPVTCKRVYQKI